MLKKIPIIIVAICLLLCCKQKPVELQDTHLFWQFYDKGDSFYINKKGIEDFEKSLLYYDSAFAIADTTSDISAKAHIHLAIGRVYDAAKHDPTKTLYYYKKAADYFRALNRAKNQIFCDYLAIHAYATAKDSLNTIDNIKVLIAQIDTIKWRNFYNIKTVCALAAIEVNNYAYAKKIVQSIDSPQTLVNIGINYADKYKIVQAKLELHQAAIKKNTSLLWQDSIQSILSKASFVYDSIDYIQLLHQYAISKNDIATANNLNDVVIKLRVRNADEVKQNSLQQKLFSHELLKKDLIASNLIAAKKNSQLLGLIFSIIAIALIVISIILFTQKKKVAQQKQYLEAANKQLAIKIADNKTLTKELHHRVKNNLYLIDGLLKLQEEKLSNTQSQQHLQAARLRVESIALLHEALIPRETGNFSFAQLVEQILKTGANTIVTDNSVSYTLSVDDFSSADIDILFPLSLIINEWVTNSLKYATTNNHHLQISISIKKNMQQIQVDYADNGIATATSKSKSGLGTSIVQLLTKQVNGNLLTLVHHPFSYTLTIPYNA
jgi:two-component sensor histidine kinase